MKKGFTLIELLVVISIIGLLSAVVFAALSSARDKGADATIKEDLLSARNQANIYFTVNNGDFTNVCPAGGVGGGAGGDPIVNQAISSAALAAGFAVNKGKCYNSTLQWAASSPLKSGGFWCVDSNGASTYEAAFLPVGQFFCS